MIRETFKKNIFWPTSFYYLSINIRIILIKMSAAKKTKISYNDPNDDQTKTVNEIINHSANT